MTNDPQTIAQWQAKIGAWHEKAFPWAKVPHIMEKLQEEQREATLAWAGVSGDDLPDELADCLICVLAAMAREGIDAEVALASKFELVATKYDRPQPAPHMRKLGKTA